MNSQHYSSAGEITASAPETTARYVYDGDGLRQSKTVNGGTPEAYTWDVAEGLPQLLQDGGVRYVHGLGGLPLEAQGGGATVYHYQDQLGSTRLLIDQVGLAVASYTFGPYGQATYTTGGVYTAFGYAGQYTDGESGLQDLQARLYDPALSQFLTRDPLVQQTQQPYAYVNDDPLNGVDPSGLCSIGPINLPIGDARPCLQDASDTIGQGLQHARPIVVPALETVSSISSKVSTGAGVVATGCATVAVFTAETGVGAVVFGACATGAGTVSVVALGVGTTADVGLAIAGHGSVKDLGLDALGLYTLGLGKGTESALEALGAEERTRKIADLTTSGIHSVPLAVLPFLPGSSQGEGLAPGLNGLSPGLTCWPLLPMPMS